MGRFHKDTLVAIFLLLFCGVFLVASFEIRETSYASLGAEVWPRVILTLLTVLSFGYLAQSLRDKRSRDSKSARGLRAWVLSYRNALWCFIWFALFLITLSYLGMLIGGCLFVYATLTSLGRRDWRSHALHAAIAVVSVGAMWALFSYGLNVFLPAGSLFGI